MRHRRPRRAALLAVAALALGACGDGDGGRGVELRGDTVTSDAGEPVDPSAVPGRRRSLGATVALASGCTACHRLGTVGNDGPGPDLSRIGARLPASAIRRTLLNPKPPMPSFASLPRKEREALVKYLSSLR